MRVPHERCTKNLGTPETYPTSTSLLLVSMFCCQFCYKVKNGHRKSKIEPLSMIFASSLPKDYVYIVSRLTTNLHTSNNQTLHKNTDVTSAFFSIKDKDCNMQSKGETISLLQQTLGAKLCRLPDPPLTKKKKALTHRQARLFLVEETEKPISHH